MNVQALGKIAVLLGGDSAERAVSLKSGQAVFDSLMRLGADVVCFDVTQASIAELCALDFDLAFIALHGRGGEDGAIQGLLNWLNKPYTGSGILPCAVAMDKWQTKQVWRSHGLATPNAFELSAQSDWSQLMAQLNGQAFVKPAREGSSIGMRKVDSAEALQESFHYAAQFDAHVIAERWVDGAEFTVGLVGDRVLPSIRLKPAHDFYDYEAKYQSNETEYFLPSGLNEEKEAELAELVLRAAQVLGIEGWARIDVMQDRDGQFWLIEANTSPGMTEKSLVPMAANAVGWSFDELVYRLLVDAKERHGA